MKISGVIEILKEIKNDYGDVEIQAFHHEGSNSLRGRPDEIYRGSFVCIENKSDTPWGVEGWIIGGPYK